MYSKGLRVRLPYQTWSYRPSICRSSEMPRGRQRHKDEAPIREANESFSVPRQYRLPAVDPRLACTRLLSQHSRVQNCARSDRLQRVQIVFRTAGRANQSIVEDDDFHPSFGPGIVFELTPRDRPLRCESASDGRESGVAIPSDLTAISFALRAPSGMRRFERIGAHLTPVPFRWC